MQQDRTNSMDASLSTIILAAGRGSRMKSDLPKVLHQILGIPMIELVTEKVSQVGSDDLTLVLGHGADQVQRALGETSIRSAIQDPQRGTADAVLAALLQQPPAHPDVLVVNGDLPDLDPELLTRFVADHRSGGSAFSVASARVADPQGMGRIVRDERGDFVAIVEQQDADEDVGRIDEVNLGLYMLQVDPLLPLLEEMVSQDLSAADPAAESYLTRVVEVMVQKSLSVAAIPVAADRQFLQVNDRRGLARVSRVFQDRLQEQLLDAGVTIVDPLTTWIELGVEIGSDTVIHPQTVIRRGVQVGRHCEIGPFAHLRGGTVIEDDVKVGDFVEINRSHLERGVRAKHLAYLGDTRVGSGANIGAGAVIANYDGTRKSPTVIGERAFIGSGCVIVAPGKIGADAVVGAGAVVPAGKTVEPGSVVIGVPARKLNPDNSRS
ncbi:MAG TPA: bifunctional N-acetylglucosamine-1-phosphate uridyltransferase/glucosamine-1-phosphate acetyltransferase [Planctomycetes bacterium]|nr:bifunctional N-acetylglucosamine-1-phosphate uridyltransferase/glucosamine-1-phosphate acetyltransferase [Planctomycetota bacterium]HIK82369.1 bifunctional N-acetylglucosamine-1-phosphate uridyltransferase/glucosamine-1-phosphate acetyltransferase [Planctomycetota bacterium]